MIKHRIIGLDIARSLAIILVVYQHILIYLPENSIFKPVKTDGVSIFFVLSGFLIGNILIEYIINNRSLFKFIVFRWFKTLPSYYFVLIILLIYFKLTNQNISQFSTNFFIFTQNLFGKHPEFFKEAWSLSVEEWIYFILPLFLLLNTFIKFNSQLFFISITILLIIVSVTLRVIYFEKNIYISMSDELRKIVIFRFDSISCGLLGSFVFNYYGSFWNKYYKEMLIFGLLGILAIELNLFSYPPSYFLYESISILLIFPFLTKINKFKLNILNLFFTYLSKISYSIYLLNLTFMQIVFMPFFIKYFHLIIPNHNFHALYYLFFTFLFSFFLNYFIEQPFLNLRYKLFKK